MAILNNTVGWVGALAAVGFGVWAIASTIANRAAAQFAARIEPRVAGCESRLTASEVTQGRIDERLSHIEATLAEIKDDTKELRGRP